MLPIVPFHGTREGCPVWGNSSSGKRRDYSARKTGLTSFDKTGKAANTWGKTGAAGLSLRARRQPSDNFAICNDLNPKQVLVRQVVPRSRIGKSDGFAPPLAPKVLIRA